MINRVYSKQQTVKTRTAGAVHLERDVVRAERLNLKQFQLLLAVNVCGSILYQRSGREISGFDRIVSAGEVALDG